MGGIISGSESDTNEFRSDPVSGYELTSQTYASGCELLLEKPAELQVAELKDIVAEMVSDKKRIDALKDWIKKDGKKHCGKGLDGIQGEYKEFLDAVKDYDNPAVVVPQWIRDFIHNVETSSDRKKERRTPYNLVITKSGTRYESVLIDGSSYFLHRTKKGGLEPVREVDTLFGLAVPQIRGDEGGAEIYQFDKNPNPIEVKTKQELYRMVLDEVKYYTNLQGTFEPYAHLVTCFILLSYQQSRFRTLPILSLHADTGHGKSIILDLVNFMGYRAIKLTSMTGPNIFHLSERGVSSSGERAICNTLVQDEADKINTDPYMIEIYRCTNESDKVPRIDKDGVQHLFSPYGLKICATATPLEDEPLRRRSVQIKLPKIPSLKPQGHIYDKLGPIERERFNRIRCELLKWSLLEGFSEEDMTIPTTETDKYGGSESYWKRILSAAHDTDGYEVVKKFFDDEVSKGLTQRVTSWKGYVAQALYECLNKTNSDGEYVVIPFSDILSDLMFITQTNMPPYKHTLTLPDGDELSTKDLAKILKSEYDGDRDKGEDKSRVYRFKVDDVRKTLKEKYGLGS